MNPGPLVSVVIPTFNQPALLRQTLASVISQTFQDFEIVVINDGSTDDTLEQLAPLAAAHAGQLRIITQENRGIGAARNRGIDESGGKYVALLDHDDLWLPGKLAAQVALFERHPELVACSVPFARSYAPHVAEIDPQKLGVVDGVLPHPLRKVGERHDVARTSVLMFNREKARGIRFGETRGVVEDMQFQILLLSRGPFGIASNEILAIYREHASNFSHRTDFYSGGIKLIRRMDREGAFAEVGPANRFDMLMYIAFLGRMATVKDLMGGNRRRAIKTYIEEFSHQIRQNRWRFVLTFPILAMLPRRWVTAVSERGKRAVGAGQE